MSNAMSKSLSEAQQLVTDKCAQHIKELIREKNTIGFDEYMQIALHHPQFGYYHHDNEIFGAQGDFTTVPEFSSHLAFCLANACVKLLRDDADLVILEIGAGSGKLTSEILKYLAMQGMLPKQYCIYEPSNALRIKQHEYIKKQLPDYVQNIQWLTDFSHTIDSAIIIANEVLDALPVKCFQVQEEKIYERAVTLNDADKFIWTLLDANKLLKTAFEKILLKLDESFSEGYQSEINLNLAPTLKSWANISQECILFLIDYGYPCREYYHSQRNMGTLRAYFKHQFNEDVLVHPGLQDITADVDFSEVARIVSALGMDILAFSSQRNFMLANDLLEWQPDANTEVERLAQIAQLKQLTLGSSMSERFQVMILGKAIDYSADQFTYRDMRARL